MLSAVAKTRRGNATVSEAAPTTKRLSEVDFAKGVLVLLMVVYHWMNYFIGLEADAFRYLRFLTPSFIFLTGFVLSHAYLGNQPKRKHISQRLLIRSLKLLGIVVFLNAAARLMGTGIASRRLGGESLTGLAWDCLTGGRPVAFSVLVPIGYLLIVFAGLWPIFRRARAVLHILSAAAIVAVVITERYGRHNGYVDMLTAGIFGASAGQLGITRIDAVVRRPAFLFTGYGLYLYALDLWDARFLVQVLGVCTNLSMFFWIGSSTKDLLIWRAVILLGEYSLFAYISQIAILQVVVKAFWAVGGGETAMLSALVVTAVSTVLAVNVVHALRFRLPIANRLYSSVFA